MINTVRSFISILRSCGISVSISEEIDCLKAIDLLGVDKDSFLAAIRITLAKSPNDRKLLNKAFGLFSVLNSFLQEPHFTDEKTGEISPLGNFISGPPGDGEKSYRTASLAEHIADATLHSDMESLSPIFDRAINTVLERCHSSDFDSYALFREVLIHLQWFMAKNLIKNIDSSGWEGHQFNLKNLEMAIKERLETQLVKRFGIEGIQKIISQHNIKIRDFSSLPDDLMPDLKRELNKLTRKLAGRKSYRLLSSRNGKVDLKRTFSQSLRFGGIPLILVKKNRRFSRPQITVLCDISNSVSPYSHFMLQFIYCLQRYFKGIRTFVFVDRPQEVTSWLETNEYQKAVENISFQSRSSVSGLSDYGKVFKVFRQDYLPLLNQQKTLIILGDAKNNWRPSNHEDFCFISQGFKQVIWLNPVAQELWYQADSQLRDYMPYCKGVFECRNLIHLETVCRIIF